MHNSSTKRYHYIAWGSVGSTAAKSRAESSKEVGGMAYAVRSRWIDKANSQVSKTCLLTYWNVVGGVTYRVEPTSGLYYEDKSGYLED